MLKVGTIISEGTLRHQDILPALVETLNEQEKLCEQGYGYDPVYPVGFMGATIQELHLKGLLENANMSSNHAQVHVAYDWSKDDDKWDQHVETIYGLIEDFIEVLQEYAPPYCRVGMHEGDGALLGVFVDVEGVQEAVQSRELVQIADPSDLDGDATTEDVEDELKAGVLAADQALHVNDHGNMALYERDENAKWRLVWDVV